MKRITSWLLPCLLAATLLVAGCGQTGKGSNQNQTAGQNQSQNTDSAQSSDQPAYQSPDQWQLVSKYYAVRGDVQSTKDAGSAVASVKIKVAENIKGADSSDDSADFPFKVGSSQDIVLQVPKASMKDQAPKQGDAVIMMVGQYANVVKGSDQPVWACAFPSGYYKKDGGKYLTLNGDVYGAPAAPPAPTTKPQGPYSTSGGKELISKLYAINATIDQLNMQGDTLHSLEVTVNENIKGADAADDDKNYPFKLGSSVEILIDEPLAQQGKLNLQKGDSVQLTVGQFAIDDLTQVWGSNYDWVLVNRDGKLYNAKGDSVNQ